MFSTKMSVTRTVNGAEYRNIHLKVQMEFQGRLPSEVTATVQREVVSNLGKVIFAAGDEIELTAQEEDSIARLAPQSNAPRRGGRKNLHIVLCDVR